MLFQASEENDCINFIKRSQICYKEENDDLCIQYSCCI
jgi:hypothetical protein